MSIYLEINVIRMIRQAIKNTFRRFVSSQSAAHRSLADVFRILNWRWPTVPYVSLVASLAELLFIGFVVLTYEEGKREENI